MSTANQPFTFDEMFKQLPLGLPEARLMLESVMLEGAWGAYCAAVYRAVLRGDDEVTNLHLFATILKHGPAEVVGKLERAGLSYEKLVSLLPTHAEPKSVTNGDLPLPSAELVRTLSEALALFRQREKGAGIITKDLVVVLLSFLGTDELLRSAFDRRDINVIMLCADFGAQLPWWHPAFDC